MDEDLLGYLFGALEPHEMRRLEDRLRTDAELRAELSRLEQALSPLSDSRDPADEPPADLVSNTLANLPPLPPVDAESDVEGQTAGATPPRLTPVDSRWDAGSGSVQGWTDWIAAATAVAILLGLLLPALAEGRFEARKVACQEQLRGLGTAITQFVLRSEHDRLPAVAAKGPEAFAGVYAIRLNDAGLLPDGSVRWCPSLPKPGGGTDADLATFAAAIDASSSARVSPERLLIRAMELHHTAVDELRELQRLVGGHYAYTLGVIDDRRFGSPRYEGRSTFAVMSDAPLGGASNPGRWAGRIGHNRRGVNVLYESGTVRFIPLEAIDRIPDHPWLNVRGEVEAGIHIDDAVLAPSWRAPFLDSPQR